jgi:hypothetical protein
MAAEKNDDDFFDTVSRMAERLGLTDDDRQRYVHEHMTRGGYRMVPNYVKDDDDGGEEGSDFFGNKKRKTGQSARAGQEGESGKSRNGGWFPS